MNRKCREKIEKWIPEITMGLCWGLFTLLFYNFNIEISQKTYENLISTSNNISSILIGFMGVLVGVLFTNNQKKIIEGFITYRKKDLKKFIIQPVVLGIVVILLGCILMIIIDNKEYINLREPLFKIWASLLIGLLVSSARIIRVIFCAVLTN